MKPITIYGNLSLLFFSCVARGQGTFQNFEFESATIVQLPPGSFFEVQFAPALAGWTGYVNTNQQIGALYNDIFLSSAGLGIIGSGSPLSGYLIQGNYTALIEAGLVLGTSIPGDASLVQTGVVPSGARSLLFAASPGNGAFAVSLGGQSLSLIPIGLGRNYTLYGADVHAWAGQQAELRFTAFADQINPGFVNILALDSIAFSSDAIPEPDFASLSALGSLLLGWLSWKRWRT